MFHRGDIYLVSLNPAQGHEQQGWRPVLVVSPDRFNELSGVALVMPVTSGGAFARNRGLAVSLHAAGTATTGIVLCHQIRTLDLEARHARFVEVLPQPVMAEILARFAALMA